ncbi:hypothetical protein PR202_ga19705 [Eleusine coracana subsp. coracana]|uniref:No apical meristem-associated C-terminal domain-containing protein n=1 Tax=Eleusine coracana subsp. coracana TaxID=191504 RepID=A0AAV5CWU4_ELECO|nr:hypothetical protein PR202_ga19705 [Eleusine coracana subsp. coracana]
MCSMKCLQGEHCSALYKGKPKQQRGKDVDNEDEDSDRARSPTPSSAPSRKRPPGRRGEKERLKKAGESGYKKSLDNMMTTRKEFAAERNEFQITKWMEMKVVEERRMVAEEKRATAEEKRTVFEERRAMVEEKRMVVEKRRAAAAKRRARSMGGFYMSGFMGGFNDNGDGGGGGNGDSSNAIDA